ncbi:MAG: ATP-binding cassette domain-containing protein [Clostridia bacterium]|nr:ATP-binding cassette domain-containing protein [Clostridia bacterium]
MIRLEQVTLTFHTKGGPLTVLDHASALFPRGKTTALIGPSGSGKTSCLQLIAGLLTPTSGNVCRETVSSGNVAHETAPTLSYLFQDLALLPWLTALQNVNLVLSDREETWDIAKEWLARVDLADAADRYPSELSGGMKQRVALARALSTEAELLLLDEPFRGLDDTLHERMRSLVASVRKEKTTILVSHDQNDLTIADHILRVEGGAIFEV